ncbi:hypothetical protein ACQP2X_42345 [Actinoplanes sp. CA-131856]
MYEGDPDKADQRSAATTTRLPNFTCGAFASRKGPDKKKLLARHRSGKEELLSIKEATVRLDFYDIGAAQLSLQRPTKPRRAFMTAPPLRTSSSRLLGSATAKSTFVVRPKIVVRRASVVRQRSRRATTRLGIPGLTSGVTTNCRREVAESSVIERCACAATDHAGESVAAEGSVRCTRCGWVAHGVTHPS